MPGEWLQVPSLGSSRLAHRWSGWGPELLEPLSPQKVGNDEKGFRCIRRPLYCRGRLLASERQNPAIRADDFRLVLEREKPFRSCSPRLVSRIKASLTGSIPTPPSRDCYCGKRVHGWFHMNE
ncbi:MAG: hypothetical protein DRJ45_06070 [Thermoprotei archaeon]|nr:MAG: hypothetical protein DRJ45_06070 [Thermoprotei archaeon]